MMQLLCNLVEEEETEIEIETNHLSFTIQPYESRHLRLDAKTT